jgi:hypothetical protein
MDFSLIHFGCPDQNGRPYFMQAINEAILGKYRMVITFAMLPRL